MALGGIISNGQSKKSKIIAQQYLSPNRVNPTTVSGRDLTNELLSDKSRVVTSSAFRRMQSKTQVFSLQENAAVRSRLTHSLEVSAIGELIATKVTEALIKRNEINEIFRIPIEVT